MQRTARQSASQRHPLTRSTVGLVGLLFLFAMVALCLLSAPYVFGAARAPDGSTLGKLRYESGTTQHARVQPLWWPQRDDTTRQLIDALPPDISEPVAANIAATTGLSPSQVLRSNDPQILDRLRTELRDHEPRFLLGSDPLGRSLLIRILAGGSISLGVGIAAAAISVLIGTLYGSIAAYAGGRIDALLMRIVDVLYGLPYILLVVLIAVAADGLIDRAQRAAIADRSASRAAYIDTTLAATPSLDPQARQARRAELEAEALARFGTGELSSTRRAQIDVLALLLAIGGVSWLTMARVVRGQVLSLKSQPFVEAARAIGAPVHWIFLKHLLPNLLGPIIVYATLTVPQAILQESFLSFLGIGIKPPLPSWGNLAADGLSELNQHRSHWWLLLFPCLLLGLTLLSLNFVGESLREAFDPKRARR